MRLGTALFFVIGSAVCSAQARPDSAMTLQDLRQYFAVMHIKEADERGVRVQMDAQFAKLPPWWPPDVSEAMTQAMLSIDLPATEFPFVKSCMSSQDAHALAALFQTPEGQTYVAKATGGMVQAESQGANAAEARQQQVQNDTGIPPAALERLTAPERQRVLKLLQGPALGCMNTGLQKASAAVGQARTEAVNKVVEQHRPELQAARARYEAGANTPKNPGTPDAPKE